MEESKSFTNLVPFVAVATWMLYMAWCSLMMAANRKEKDGSFINELGSKTWSKYFFLGFLVPYWLFPNIYTEKGNKYRVKFLWSSAIGIIGVISMVIINQFVS